MYKLLASLSIRAFLLVVVERLALLALSVFALARPSVGAGLVAWVACVLAAIVWFAAGPLVAGYRLGRRAAREGRPVELEELAAIARAHGENIPRVMPPPPGPAPVRRMVSMTPDLKAQIDEALRMRWERIAVRTLYKLEPRDPECLSLDCPSSVHLSDALAKALAEADREEQDAMIASLGLECAS